MVSADRLRAVIDYDPDTGTFRWKSDRISGRGRIHAKAGSVAGSASGRYYRITVDGAEHSAHRLAWLYMTGEWPSVEIDHRDGDKHNNKWSNLRCATSSQNKCNSRARSNKRTTQKGVDKISRNLKRPYRARIRVGNLERHLGYFATSEEAHEAYRAAAKSLHGEFARMA